MPNRAFSYNDYSEILTNFASEKRNSVETYLSELNESQRKAVLYCDGPALVVAGAGSGKTRVLTYKIAWLIEQGLPPYTILALTFTNKAAREMKERIAAIVGEEVVGKLWMGTFHSVFLRILRREAARLGFSSNFTIYDAADSKNLIKAIIKEMQLDDKVYRPATVQSQISNAKNALITWRSYEQNNQLMELDRRNNMPLISEIYQRYQTRCRQAEVMDFDDLLLQTNILFRDNPDVLEKYRNQFRYVLVDEYQDTNFSQHLIVQRLCEGHGHICVVGDDAQSIYSFRGASIDNILKFQNIYKGCQVFKLERNYRSTKNIVNVANSLIDKNVDRIPKRVYSEKEEGSKIKVIATSSDYEEAYAVAGLVSEMKRRSRGSYSDTAVLYRTNAQSRTLEEAFRKRGIPYRIYGGLSFYQRKEIKDVLSYFRLVVNPNDEEALKRVINYPTRGIGATTLDKLVDAAVANQTSIWKVLSAPLEYGVSVNSGTARKLADFKALIDEYIQRVTSVSADELASDFVKKSGLITLLTQDHTTEGIARLENVQELLKGIYEFCDMRREEGRELTLLADYLSEISLLTDQDTDDDEDKEKVTMMTVHASKGLEFRNVIIVGMEEDLFPSARTKASPKAIEEERRLFYVAITRAEVNCCITYARTRFINGKTNSCHPSRFIKDLDSQYLEMPTSLMQSPAIETYSETRSYRPSAEYTRPAGRSQAEMSFERREPVVSTPKRLVRIGSASTSAPSATGIGGIAVGRRVSHDRFGEGVVMAIEGDAQNTKALVDFDNFGKKQLLLKFARLKVLD